MSEEDAEILHLADDEIKVLVGGLDNLEVSEADASPGLRVGMSHVGTNDCYEMRATWQSAPLNIAKIGTASADRKMGRPGSIALPEAIPRAFE
jgi:catalase (peroxidase I)